MEEIITAIMLFIIGIVFKNIGEVFKKVLNQSSEELKQIFTTNYGRHYQSVEPHEFSYYKTGPDHYEVTDFSLEGVQDLILKDVQENNIPTPVEEESTNVKDTHSFVSNDHRDSMPDKTVFSEHGEILSFNPESVLNGIIMSELLGPPKALNHVIRHR